MKKKFILVLVVFLFLSGCQSKLNNELNSKKLDTYTFYIDKLQLNEATQESSTMFEIRSELSKRADGTNLYYIIIDNAVENMYNVKLIALEEGVDGYKIMAPSIGILDDETYNLVSNESPVKEGYVKGLVLSGETQNNPINLKIMISWTDQSGNKKNEEFLLVHIDDMNDNEE